MTTHTPCTIVDGIHREELAANARLIAAAPELLEACKAALQQVQEFQSGRDDSTEEAEEILRAAIAKAEGTA